MHVTSNCVEDKFEFGDLKHANESHNPHDMSPQGIPNWRSCVNEFVLQSVHHQYDDETNVTMLMQLDHQSIAKCPLKSRNYLSVVEDPGVCSSHKVNQTFD